MQMFIDGLIFTLAFILIPAAALLADPPGEDVLYPESTIVNTAAGNLFIQLDAGATQSSLQGNKGFHAPDADPDVVPGYLKSSNGVAPNVGLTLGYRFNKSFSLGLRVDYDSRHVANNGTFQTMCTEYDPENGDAVEEHLVDVQDKYEATVDYLSISALPSVHFDDFFVFAGPSIGIPLSRTIKQSNTLTDPGSCEFFYGSSSATKSISGTLDGKTNLKQRIALKLGVGYLFPLTGNVGLVFQAGADVGASDLLEKDEDLMLRNPAVTGGPSAPSTINAAMRFHSAQGSIGLRINI
jgi:opacity protein-like surface antigen